MFFRERLTTVLLGIRSLVLPLGGVVDNSTVLTEHPTTKERHVSIRIVLAKYFVVNPFDASSLREELGHFHFRVRNVKMIKLETAFVARETWTRTQITGLEEGTFEAMHVRLVSIKAFSTRDRTRVRRILMRLASFFTLPR